MSLLWVDSFDHYTTVVHKYPSEGGNPTIISGGRNSTQCFHTSTSISTGKWAERTIGGTAVTIVTGAAFRFLNTAGTTPALFTFHEGATIHVDLRLVTGTQVLRVTRNGTQIGSDGTTVLSLDTWYYIEFKATIHDTTGSFSVHVNGVNESMGTQTNIDTRNAGTPLVDRVRLGGAVSTGLSWDADDWYVLNSSGSAPNNDFLGDIRVAAVLPSGAGNSTQWTPSAGSNFQNVDETPPDDDTTYNSEATASDKDTFAMGNIPSTPTTIYGVMQGARHRKDDAGSRTLRQVVRSGGTDYEGSDISVSDTYQFTFEPVRETDPNTAAAWTESGFNAVEAGYKLQA
jgi:hypothetical protein